MWYIHASNDEDDFHLRHGCSWAILSCLFFWKVQGSIICFGHFSSDLLLNLCLPCDYCKRSYVHKYTFNSCQLLSWIKLYRLARSSMISVTPGSKKMMKTVTNFVNIYCIKYKCGRNMILYSAFVTQYFIIII